MHRIKSVDTFRIIAITAVVAIHTEPFNDLPGNDLYLYLFAFIKQLARFAVPFFFIMAGFFYARKITEKSMIFSVSWSMVNRLMIVFFFWSFIYLIFTVLMAYEQGGTDALQLVYQKLLEIVRHPVYFLFNGTKLHLWFLPSLASAVIITAAFLYFNALRLLIVVAFVMYMIGLCTKSYIDLPFGFHLGFDTHKGPFFSTLFFVTGYMLSHLKVNTLYLKYGLLITVFGFFVHFGEIGYLYLKYNFYPLKHEFLLGTYFFGLGVAMMAISNHKIFSSSRLSTLGKYTLGVYMIHYIFVDLFKGIDQKISHPIWEISFIFIVLIISILATYLFSRSPFLKKLFI